MRIFLYMGQFFRHLFLPHHTNNFKAKVLHSDFFLVYVIAFLALSFFTRAIHKINPDILGFATNIHVNQLLSLTNQERQSAGLSPLKFNAQLSNAAYQKAQDMFRKNYWAHTAPDGTTPWDFINSSGYVYTVAGENLAKNFSDSQGVVVAWMNSPTHRENILRSEYQDIGFAVVNGVLNGEETTLVVQMFGKGLSTQKPAEIAQAEPTIPIAEAQASEKELPIQLVSQEEKQASIASAPITPQKPVAITQYAGSVVKKPWFDISHISKNTALGIAIFLALVLLIDGIYVWRKGIARIGGRNLAHLFFLTMMFGFAWFMSWGSIL